MEGSILVNLFIQQIKQEELKLSEKYPYLSTIYHVMVYIYMEMEIFDHTEKVRNKLSSSKKLTYTANETIKFFGDIIEAEYRGDKTKRENVVNTFCVEWNISRSIVAHMVAYIRLVAVIEVPIVVGEKTEKQKGMLMMLKKLGKESYEWLSPFQYIGGSNRNIMHTVRLLQFQSKFIGERLLEKANEGCVIALPTFQRGMFSKPSNMKQNGATKITLDMDEFFMCDVMPNISSICLGGRLSIGTEGETSVPHENELLGFFSVIKSHLETPEDSISWSCAFAVHALLTSVFEMQGQGDTKQLSTKMKATFHTYMYQIDSVQKGESRMVVQPSWVQSLKLIQTFRYLVPPVMKREVTSDGVSHWQAISDGDQVIWNPLVAGQFLGYLCYYCNLNVGMAMIDSFAQLCIVLHIYNAFIQLGVLKVGDVEFVDWLFDKYKNCYGVWLGTIPQHGEFVERLWYTVGMAPNEAKRRATTIHNHIRELIPDINSMSSNQRFTGSRKSRKKSSSNDPWYLSTSYRRVCFYDSNGVQDRRPSEEKRVDCNCWNCMTDTFAFCSDTFYHMNKEQRMLATNFTLVGCRLYDFVIKLYDLLGWEAEMMRTKRNPIFAVDCFVEELLSVLDVIRNLNDYPIYGQPCCPLTRTAQLFKWFFNGKRFQPERISFFAPNIAADEEGDNAKSVHE